MSDAWVYVGSSLVSLGVGSGISYRLAKRSTSGSVATSEAATVWEQFELLRKELRDELVAERLVSARERAGRETAEALVAEQARRIARYEADEENTRRNGDG